MNQKMQVEPLDLLKESNGGTRSDRLFEKIKDMIIDGVLPPGYTFPNENEMCAQLSIGRSTLREAYRSLSTVGLINRNKTGTYVNDLETIIEAAPFNIAVEMSSSSDIIEFRMMLESENAKYTAQRATEAELKQIAALLAESRENYGQYLQLQQLDIRFHMMIAEFSHNYLLRSALLSSWDSFEEMVSRNYHKLTMKSPDVINTSVDDHHRIFDAICKRDPAGAKREMRQHIRNVYGIGADHPLFADGND